VNHYSQGNYQAAYQEALSRGQIKENGASKDLLWSLNAGSSAFFTGQYGNAINIFDFAENQMKLNDTQGVAAEGATTTAALLINDNVRDYQFTSYDAVMLNTYKALAFLGDRKKDSARVEFNRADDRQRRAVEQFSKERQNLAKSLEAQSQQDPSVDYNSTLQAAVGNKDFVERMQAIDKWGSYGPFVNPLATYLHGLFFLHQTGSDAEKGRASIERVVGLAPNNPTVRSDMELVKQGRIKEKRRAWIVLENGQGASLQEFRIDLPIGLIVPDSNLAYTGIALPELVANQNAYRHLIAKTGEAQINTAPLSSMDRVIASEFKQRMPATVTRAVVSAVVKSAAQYAISQAAQSNSQQNQGVAFFATLAAGIAQAATTSADVRSWIALPKEFQVGRVDLDSESELSLYSDQGFPLGSIQLPGDASCIIYIKTYAAGALPAIQVIPL